jgi:perosamine synthetase
MPAFTIISCAAAALRFGAIPVLVDSEPETWNMDVSQVERLVTPRTRAIMAVHIYGHPVDMDPLLEIARKHGLLVIEDAAEVHGAEYKGRKCGAIGDISAFSFYANKIVTTGEGGMVLTSNGEMAARARSYRNLCFRPDRRFFHTELGNNLRMTNLQAAVGVAQMERIEEFVALKRKWGGCYREGLSRIEGIKCQVEKPWAKMVYWMYCIELDARLELSAEKVIAELGRRGIGSRPFFLGLHEQPVLQERGLFKGLRFPVCERISRLGLYLPSGLTLNEDKIDSVVSNLGAIVAESKHA